MEKFKHQFLIVSSTIFCTVCYAAIVYFIVDISTTNTAYLTTINRQKLEQNYKKINELEVKLDERTKDRYHGADAKRDKEIILNAIAKACAK
jgi:hypothetical protein